MKKLFSHPLFYNVFLLLGLLGMGAQFWFAGVKPDAAGLLPEQHPATVITIVLTVITALLAVLTTPFIQMPRHSAIVRAVGGFAAGGFMLISAILQLVQGDVTSGVLALLAAMGSVYVGICRMRKAQVHYTAYALFALCFMVYLISSYRVWSAEPETVRYLFQLLALVCSMLVFYQKAALRAHTGKFATYHFWHCMTLMLCLTAAPTATNPTLYLAAAIWMILDSSPRRKEAQEEAQ